MLSDRCIFLCAALSAWLKLAHSFTSTSAGLNQLLRPSTADAASTSRTRLFGGVGVASTYSWNEEQFEIEVKLKVPPRTSAKDIKFRCSSESIDLRLLNCPPDDNVDGGGDGKVGERVLLDGKRKMRGKICVDGTFWQIESGSSADEEREVTVTIEKHFVPVSSSGGTQTYDTLTDFDWGGLYPNDEEEVTHRKYDEAEELNVRDYAASLGVDIGERYVFSYHANCLYSFVLSYSLQYDAALCMNHVLSDNIDMSKVNKTMFGAGLANDAESALSGFDGNQDDWNSGDPNGGNQGFRFNMTQATLEQLTKAGLAKEVVQQGDGTEYELGTDGRLDEDRIFSMLGKDVTADELVDAGIVGGDSSGGRIPTLWGEQTVPVEEAPGYQKTFEAGNQPDGIIESEIVEREVMSEGTAVDASATEVVVEDESNANTAKTEVAEDEVDDASAEQPMDPIDLLTVARLKEILRAQGLKVSGTKQELRDRLRGHVDTLLKEE